MRTVVLLALIGLVHAAQEPASSPDRELHWRQDLQALSAGLKAPGIRIAGGIATKGQKDFAQLYPHFDGDIWSIQNELPKLTDSEVLLRLMKLIASAHVGHNRIQIPTSMGFANRLPVSFHWFADGLAVSAATEEYASALGARVLSIGGRTADQFLHDLAPYISYENDTTLHAESIGLMNAAGVLRHFGMVDAGGQVAVRLQKSDGQTMDLPMPLVAGAKRILIDDGLHLVKPLARTQRGYYWHEYAADSQTLYIQYNVCESDPKERFSDFAKKVLAEADAHSVKRVVLDLRNNGGGNSRVIGPLKDGLAARASRLGPLYVLIGAATFSSAVDNAATLRRELSAKLLGEPSGGMPGGYGEVSTVTLPNSKLVVRFTTKGSPPKEGEPTQLIPDIAAPTNLADYLAGHDPALDAALHAN